MQILVLKKLIFFVRHTLHKMEMSF